MDPRRLAQARRALRARLDDRRPEIEQAILSRVYGISDPTDADPAYLEGLRDAVAIALDYGLETIERSEEHAPPPPPALRAQARMAARSGIGLDTVLRRYFAGYTLLDDFIVKEAERGLGTPAQLLLGRDALFDRLLAAVSEEYEREAKSRASSVEQRRAERVERLLAGEPLDTASLGYPLEGHHVGIVAAGPTAETAIRRVAAELDRRLLLVSREGETVWAWLGGRRGVDLAAVDRAILSGSWGDSTFALGEPAQDIAGWRLTHRQAAAALPIALKRGDPCVHYADVALLASVLRDDLLVAYLDQAYLTPLADAHDDGSTLRETLHAYFAADRNVSSAAAALGVNRNTVANRLKVAEAAIGHSLHSCAAELEVALRLAEQHSHLLPIRIGNVSLGPLFEVQHA